MATDTRANSWAAYKISDGSIEVTMKFSPGTIAHANSMGMDEQSYAQEATNEIISIFNNCKQKYQGKGLVQSWPNFTEAQKLTITLSAESEGFGVMKGAAGTLVNRVNEQVPGQQAMVLNMLINYLPPPLGFLIKQTSYNDNLFHHELAHACHTILLNNNPTMLPHLITSLTRAEYAAVSEGFAEYIRHREQPPCTERLVFRLDPKMKNSFILPSILDKSEIADFLILYTSPKYRALALTEEGFALFYRHGRLFNEYLFTQLKSPEFKETYGNLTTVFGVCTPHTALIDNVLRTVHDCPGLKAKEQEFISRIQPGYNQWLKLEKEVCKQSLLRGLNSGAYPVPVLDELTFLKNASQEDNKVLRFLEIRNTTTSNDSFAGNIHPDVNISEHLFSPTEVGTYFGQGFFFGMSYALIEGTVGKLLRKRLRECLPEGMKELYLEKVAEAVISSMFNALTQVMFAGMLTLLTEEKEEHSIEWRLLLWSILPAILFNLIGQSISAAIKKCAPNLENVTTQFLPKSTLTLLGSLLISWFSVQRSGLQNILNGSANVLGGIGGGMTGSVIAKQISCRKSYPGESKYSSFFRKAPTDDAENDTGSSSTNDLGIECRITN